MPTESDTLAWSSSNQLRGYGIALQQLSAQRCCWALRQLILRWLRAVLSNGPLLIRSSEDKSSTRAARGALISNPSSKDIPTEWTDCRGFDWEQIICSLWSNPSGRLDGGDASPPSNRPDGFDHKEQIICSQSNPLQSVHSVGMSFEDGLLIRAPRAARVELLSSLLRINSGPLDRTARSQRRMSWRRAQQQR